MDMDFENKNVVFLGIGGISMSGLARMLKNLGAHIFGNDIVENEQIKALKRDKIAKIRIGNVPVFIQNADFVIYTNAINKNNPDLSLARRLNKKVLERSTLLGILGCKFKHLIAISGTHGKTTTTSLIGWVFETANLMPTVHIGGISKNFGSNVKIGKNKFLITEACEYRKSFLQLNPCTTLINNIELDHTDCYANLKDVENAFVQLSKQTKQNLIINGDSISKKLFENKNILTFGLNNSNNLYATNLRTENNLSTFDVIFENKKLGSICTNLLGIHNVYNILGAVLVAVCYKIEFNYIKTAIESFLGTERRFEKIYDKDFSMFLDYAHHPSEIKCCLEAAQKIKKNRVVVVFQPHTYSRTLGLKNEFSTSFSMCDVLYLLPTYAAREKEIIGGRAIDLFYEIKNVKTTQYITNTQSLFLILNTNLQKDDLVIWMGAGNVENSANEYVKTLNKIK